MSACGVKGHVEEAAAAGDEARMVARGNGAGDVAANQGMAPLWHQGTIAPRAPQKNENMFLGKNAPKQILAVRAFYGPREPAHMRKPSEMYLGSRMQHVQTIPALNLHYK